MLVKTPSIIQSLATVLLVAVGHVEAHPAPESSDLHTHIARSTFRDEFTTFDTSIWKCEYTCPVIETGKARYRLKSGVAPDNYGSWSKSSYTPQRFTKGNFTVSFSLTARPTGHPVWWGIALWDDGPTADQKQFNEINFGYTTNQGYTNSQLRFESAKRGVDTSLQVDTGVDLYSEEYHTASLVYDSTHVAFYFDGKKLKEITNTSVIPTDEMDLVLGTRLVTGGSALTTGFTQSVDWVQITV